MNRALLSPASALIAHIEPLVTDRRVLVVGNAERSAAEHLLARGARLVQVLDPDARRVAHAAAHNSERRVTFAQLTDSSLRDGSFDCTVVEDVDLADDLGKLVAGVKRAMNNRGVAIFCSGNSDTSTGLLGVSRGSVDYDGLCDATEAHFDEVIMLGQSPFLGYSVVQFDLDHAPEPALDNAYLNQEGETPDFYIALCGSQEALGALSLEEMSIVQLPAARFVENSEQIHRERELRAARRVENLEAELKTARNRSSQGEMERLNAELEQRDSWIKQLESRAAAADARADDASGEVEELEQELEDTHQTLLKERDAHKKEIERVRNDTDRSAADTEIARLKKSLDQARRDAEVAKRDAEDAKRDAEDAKRDAKDAKRAAEDAKREAAKSTEADAEIARLKKSLDQARRDAEDAKRGAADRDARELVQLKKSLEKARGEADEAKHHSAGREALEGELNALDEEKQKLAASLKDKSQALERLEKRLAESEKEIDDLHDQLDETEALLDKTKSAAPQESSLSQKEVERDLVALEDQLRKRGERVAELEFQLKKLETYAKTLTAELALQPSAKAAEPDQTKVDALAKALAEREADLVAAEWTIGQLKQTTLKD